MQIDGAILKSMLTQLPEIKNARYFGKNLLTLMFASILLSSFAVLTQNVPASATYSIVKEQSGLIASDPLNNETETQQQVLADQKYWTYYGTAVSEKDTAYYVYKDSQGLHIGEPGPNDAQFGAGSYSGYYAVSPDTSNALVSHVIITTTNTTVAQYDFQPQIEIMPSSGTVNYITCGAVTNSQGTYWEVVHGSGNGVEADQWTTLWEDTSANQPLTRDCTVVTNGQNLLKVYVDGILRYNSSTLALNMPQPLDYYLQTMNSDDGINHLGIYRDYYLTSSDTVTVNNIPSTSVGVKLVNSTGGVLASSSVNSGSASLEIGQYDMPLEATINVYDSSNNVIASSLASMYGGDVFSVTSSSQTTMPSSPQNLQATAGNSQVALSWSAPSNNGGSTITGYGIYRGTTSGGEGTTPIATVNGSTLTYTDAGLTNGQTYYYTVIATNSVGVSSPSNEASATPASAATAPQPPTGLTATATSSSQINLSWNPPSNNGGATITGYKIDRSTDGGSTWSTLVANTGSAATTYSDTGLAASTTYTYRVSAINSEGTSSPSSTASATTPLLSLGGFGVG